MCYFVMRSRGKGGGGTALRADDDAPLFDSSVFIPLTVIVPIRWLLAVLFRPLSEA